MRFFKYLLLTFASIISVNSIASGFSAGDGTCFADAGSACDMLLSQVKQTEPNLRSVRPEGDKCHFFDGQNNYIRTSTLATCELQKCPPKNTLKVFWFPKGTSVVPTKTCDNGCTYTGPGVGIDTNNFVSVTMQSTGDTKECTNETAPRTPTTCNKNDPYGDCFVPPDDNCLRTSDGSIHCPDNKTPPNNKTCNGASYCKRPPEGCGPGYVSGSFNDEQLCVRSGPNIPKNPPEPDNPQDPQNCMNGGSYCSQPPENSTCPAGYYQAIHNGLRICVKNNPDPTQPNPNDPTGGYGPDNSGGDGGNNGGIGSIDLKPVIDAIKDLKASLLNAIAIISGKLDVLIAGQKTGNEHLKNIKDESVKTNEKLDTSNGHLEKIEEATNSTSEAVGETNKKLDSIKDAIDSQSKCLDKNSGKYRECTPDDFSAASTPDGKVDILEREIDTNFDGNIISVSDQCPPPMVIRFNLLEEHVITFSYDNFCYGASLARPWVIFVGMLTAFLIVTGQIRGGSDD